MDDVRAAARGQRLLALSRRDGSKTFDVPVRSGGRATRPSGHRSEFGVMEPTPDAAAVIPDLLLVPLLAFDRLGGRLGYGAGHYDRTLADLRSVRSIFALGVGFAVQEMAVPSEAHDQRLDAVVTERGYWLMEPSFP